MNVYNRKNLLGKMQRGKLSTKQQARAQFLNLELSQLHI